MKKLSIGMSVYDDYDGAYFTVQSLRMHHLRDIDIDFEFIIIDNNPNSPSGRELEKFATTWAQAKYVPYTKKIGSAASKNEIFNHASGDFTLCIDCHVLFSQGAINELLAYYKRNPNTNDLIQGPLWHDDLKNISTHFKQGWGSAMYGQWDSDMDRFFSGEPFEIDMQGMGAFSCRTSAWPGFSPHFRGFGGEEGYIHEKFRRAGGKCICIPQMCWVHRFGRPNGVPYPNIIEDRAWNYFVGWLELLKTSEHPFFDLMIEEFKSSISEGALLSIFEEAKNKVL